MTRKIIRTTLGDLIAALSDEMDRTSNGQQEVDNAVAYLLADLLHSRSGRFKARNYQVLESMSEMNHRLACQ